MARWILAFALASGTILWGVPKLRTRAFRAGWFERGSQTRRRRSQRRPTHGGLLLAVALAAGAVLTGPGEPAARAVLAAAVLTVASCFQAEAGRGPTWLVPAGRVAVAVVVPLTGVRAELTGSDGVDAVLTAVAVLIVITGLRSVERSDGTVPALGAIAAAPLLAVAVRLDDPVAPLAAAVVGAGLALVAEAWPPAAVRIGAMGPTVLGATLAVVAIELDPQLAGSHSVAVPLLALATIGVAFLVPRLDLRLRRRRVPCHLIVPLVAIFGAYASHRLANGSLQLAPAVQLALIPAGLLLVVGLVTRLPRRDDEESHRVRNASLVGVGVLLLALVGTFAAKGLWSAREDMEHGREYATSGSMPPATATSMKPSGSSRPRTRRSPTRRTPSPTPSSASAMSYRASPRTCATRGRWPRSAATCPARPSPSPSEPAPTTSRWSTVSSRSTRPAVSAELEPALDTLRSAATRLDEGDSAVLVAEVRDGADAVADRIAEATESIEVAAEATRLAPDLLGADRDRRWIVAVVGPSEQRGAGGLAGDYAELRASDGDIELVQTLPARELNAATDPDVQLAGVPDAYRQTYGGFRVGRFWQNLSATPDIPTFGEGIAAAYPLTDGGGPVDGVITIDPKGIAGLLELTGPLRVKPWPVPLTSSNVARALQYGHYEGLDDEQRDAFQGDVIEAVVDALTTGAMPPMAEMAAVLGPQVAGGHLHLWSPEDDPQALFERVGADGHLGTRPPGTDFVQLVTQNDGENKIDAYMHRSLTYDAIVDPETGALAATATVTILNNAPPSGVSSYIIGEEGGPTQPGENELEVTIFSPHRMISARDAHGNRLPVSLAREQGLNAVTVFLEIPSWSTATIVVTFQGSLEPTDGHYSLTMGRQSAVWPDVLDAHVTGAPGWRLPRGARAEVVSEDDRPATLEATFTR